MTDDLQQRRRLVLASMEALGVRTASTFAVEQAEHPPQRGFPALTRFFSEAEAVGGAEGATLWRVRTEIAVDGTPTRQGYRCPTSAWGGAPDGPTLAALTGESDWNAIDPETILYLDTETTGLSTGAGSVAFLIGVGRFVAGGTVFELDQYYIDDFAAEPLLIEAVDARLRAAGGLVTYNGRTFDMPLLASRWVMARRPPRFPELHLDLLHYARRLWRATLPGCGLGEVERGVMGIRRMSDMPGHMIPGIWLEAQRGIHPERLVPVFDHHAQDIVSMGALAALLSKAWREPDCAAFARAEVQWGLARLFEARGDSARAIARIEAAALAARDPELEFLLAMRLARAYKRAGRIDEALAIWTARVAHCRPGRLGPLIELAKHAEHALKDFEQARHWTERAMAILAQRGAMRDYGVAAAGDGGESSDLERRRNRIVRKGERRQIRREQ